MRTAPRVRLLRGERSRLVELARGPGGRPRVARRARLILRAADGLSDVAIAKEVGCSPATVATWRRRFLAQRAPGLERESPRSGRPPSLSPARIREIVRMTLGRRPPGGGTWTSRQLAGEAGVSKSTVQRIWRAHQIEPERPVETLRRDPGARFVERVTDLVGLYYHPPDRAMAFSVDERGRATPLLPLRSPALAPSEEARRALEFRAFLQAIDRETPPGLDVHLLVDGRLAPSGPEVRRWLGRHPRFYLHTLPTDRAEPNVIDRWWASLLRARRRPGATPSVARLRRAFRHHFESPASVHRAFVWTAAADEIRGPTGRPPERSPSAGAGSGAPERSDASRPISGPTVNRGRPQRPPPRRPVRPAPERRHGARGSPARDRAAAR